MLADDHALNLRLCKMMLESKLGVEVETADDGDSALAQLKADPSLSLCLMDLQMSRMGGLEATRRFRAWEAVARPGVRLPIHALSASCQDEVLEDCVANGLDGFLAKPPRLGAVRDVLRAHGLEGGGTDV